MQKVLKFDDDLGDFIPYFCNSCNDNVNTSIIIKVGIHLYKSPLCFACNQIRGITIVNREEVLRASLPAKNQEVIMKPETQGIIKTRKPRVSRKVRIFKRSSI